MRRSYLVVLAVLFLVLSVATATTYFIRKQAKETVRDAAAASLFSEAATAAYTDIEGRSIDLSGANDQVVIATTWASWCPQCADELVLLDEIIREYGDGRVRVFALNRNEPKAQAQRFISTLPELPNVQFVLDNQDFFFDSVGGYAMPETVLYNQAGEVILHKRGNLTREEMISALEALLVASN